MNTCRAQGSSRSGVITVVCFTLLGAIGVRTASAADEACKPVFDAISRLVKTPNHQYLTQFNDAPGSPTHVVEIISTARTTYTLHDGKWLATPTAAAEMLRQDEENRKNSKMTCGLVRSELIDGVNANLYTVHSESKFGNSDGQIWISKADPLPVHQKIELAVDGTAGKTHIETRFVYLGVAPPAGMK